MDCNRGSVVLCFTDLNTISGGLSIKHLKVRAKVDAVHILTNYPVQNGLEDGKQE